MTPISIPVGPNMFGCAERTTKEFSPILEKLCKKFLCIEEDITFRVDPRIYQMALQRIEGKMVVHLPLIDHMDYVNISDGLKLTGPDDPRLATDKWPKDLVWTWFQEILPEPEGAFFYHAMRFNALGQVSDREKFKKGQLFLIAVKIARVFRNIEAHATYLADQYTVIMSSLAQYSFDSVSPEAARNASKVFYYKFYMQHLQIPIDRYVAQRLGQDHVEGFEFFSKQQEIINAKCAKSRKVSEVLRTFLWWLIPPGSTHNWLHEMSIGSRRARLEGLVSQVESEIPTDLRVAPLTELGRSRSDLENLERDCKRVEKEFIESGKDLPPSSSGDRTQHKRGKRRKREAPTGKDA